MRNIARLLLFLCLCLCLPASAIVLTVNTSDFASFNLKVKQVTVTPDAIQTNGTYIVALDPRALNTDTNGSVSFTNVVPNGYTIDIGSSVHTHFHITITNGTPIGATLNAKDLITTSTNNGGTNAYSMLSSDGRYSFAFTNTALWVDPSGSDSTGRRGRSDKPFATPKAAVTAASAGDTVIVFPGTYTNQNALGKNMVNIHNDGTISYIETSTNGVGVNLGRGFLDDRDGVLTNIISGYGKWIYSAGTNVANYDTNAFVYVNNPNTRGAVVLTNHASSLRWESGDVYMGSIGGSSPPFFMITNTVNNVIHINDMYDMYYPTISFDTIVFGPLDMPSTSTGLYWSSGESTPFQFNHIHKFGGLNPLWWDEAPITHTNFEGHAWIKGNLSETYFYISGKTSTWRTWWDVSEMVVTNGSCWTILGPGKHYIINQKSDSFGGDTLSMGESLNKDDLTVWLFSEAFKSNARWLAIKSGTLYANILHFEDTGANGGTVDEGIKVFAPDNIGSNAFVNLTGLTIQANNGRPFSLLGGTNIFTGLTIRSTNNTCAFVTGGYNLFNACLLISKTTSNSIDSGAVSASVGNIGGLANRPKGANVTISPGTFTVDSNLK